MKLLLCPGHAWAASTPMYYTLGYYNKYCHTGHIKEFSYLWQMYLEYIEDIKLSSLQNDILTALVPSKLIFSIICLGNIFFSIPTCHKE